MSYRDYYTDLTLLCTLNPELKAYKSFLIPYLDRIVQRKHTVKDIENLTYLLEKIIRIPLNTSYLKSGRTYQDCLDYFKTHRYETTFHNSPTNYVYIIRDLSQGKIQGFFYQHREAKGYLEYLSPGTYEILKIPLLIKEQQPFQKG